MASYSKAQIQQVLDRTNLLDVIGAQVKLQQAGPDRLKGCCPFHQEKTPSFVVYTQRQDYHCFGCSAHGNAINFVMQQQGLGYRQAIEELAQSCGVKLTLIQSADAREKAAKTLNAIDVLQHASDYFHHALDNHMHASIAANYIASRSISAESCSTFALGFAPPGWDNLTSHWKDQQQTSQVATSLGLIKQGNRGYYDQFRERLMFPIRNSSGQVVGFGGRSLQPDQQPKYLNSTDSEIFSKHHVLYGLYEAMQARTTKTLLVVEGYMDVLMLHQSGFTNAVACLGTALGQTQIQIMLRYTHEICFLFDGDNAGRQAAIKAMQLCKPFLGDDKMFRFVLLPDGEDPDSFLQSQGTRAMKELLTQHANTWSQFFLHWLWELFDYNTVEGKSAIDARSKKEIEPIQDYSFRRSLENEIRDKLGFFRRRSGSGGKFSRQQTNNIYARPAASGSSKSTALSPPIQTYTVEIQRENQLLLLIICIIRRPAAWLEQATKGLEIIKVLSHLLPAHMVNIIEQSTDADAQQIMTQVAIGFSQTEQQTLQRLDAALTGQPDETYILKVIRELVRLCWAALDTDAQSALIARMPIANRKNAETDTPHSDAPDQARLL